MDFVGAGPREFDDNIAQGDDVIGFFLDTEGIGNHLVEESFVESFGHVFFDI